MISTLCIMSVALSLGLENVGMFPCLCTREAYWWLIELPYWFKGNFSAKKY